MLFDMLFDPFLGELVTDASGGLPRFFFIPLFPRRGGEPNEVVYESNQRLRPTLRVHIKDRGRGELEFVSAVSRAVIDSPLFLPTRLITAFALDCPTNFFFFFDAPVWRSSGGTNIRTP
jgi:hypothetical protein